MGNNLFNKTCDKIESNIAPIVQQNIINEILDVYPNLTIIPVGSVGKKSDYNSDIDIAIVTYDIDHLREIISNVFDYTESITIESLYIISIKYPYLINNTIKYVQCDFINVWNVEYTKFRYYCPDYTKNESKYKVGQKIMFAHMIINHTKERNENIKNNQYGRFLFNPTALYKRIVDTSESKYIDKVYTMDPYKIANMCFNDGDISHFNSIETLWEGIHSDNYKYPEEVKNIERNFFINCYKKGWNNITPEDFKLQYWTNDEILYFISEQKYINKINNIFAKVADMENK
jgi:hypothetical protein